MPAVTVCVNHIVAFSMSRVVAIWAQSCSKVASTKGRKKEAMMARAIVAIDPMSAMLLVLSSDV